MCLICKKGTKSGPYFMGSWWKRNSGQRVFSTILGIWAHGRSHRTPSGKGYFLADMESQDIFSNFPELICGKYVEKVHLSKVNEGLSECPTPLWLLCYNYLNVSTNDGKKLGELGSGIIPWETHRMYEMEMGIPKLPLWLMAYNRCWFIQSLYFLLWEEWTCCKKQLLDMHISMY